MYILQGKLAVARRDETLKDVRSFYSMKKIFSITFFVISIGLIGCSGVKSASDSEPNNYTHLIESAFVHPYEELLVEAGAPWGIYFESTNENYDSVYSGVLWLNRKQVSIQGIHWPNYEDERPCANVIGSLPLASNSVIFDTIIFNDAFQETTNFNQPHHQIAFVFPNGINGTASVHVCLTSFNGVDTEPSAKSLHTLSFQRVR